MMFGNATRSLPPAQKCVLFIAKVVYAWAATAPEMKLRSGAHWILTPDAR